MARLTESQKYEVGMEIYKFQKRLENELERAVVGDIVTVEMKIQMKIGETEVNRITNEFKFKEV